jgi:hypothetical protein
MNRTINYRDTMYSGTLADLQWDTDLEGGFSYGLPWEANPAPRWLGPLDDAKVGTLETHPANWLRLHTGDFKAMDARQLVDYFNGERRIFRPGSDPDDARAVYQDNGTLPPFVFRGDGEDKVMLQGLEPKLPASSSRVTEGDLRNHSYDSGDRRGRGGFVSTSESPFIAGQYLSNPDRREMFSRDFDGVERKPLAERRGVLENSVAKAALKQDFIDNPRANDGDFDIDDLHVTFAGGVREPAFILGFSHIYAIRTPAKRSYLQNALDTKPVLEQGPESEISQLQWFQDQMEVTIDGSIGPELVHGRMPMIVIGYMNPQGFLMYGGIPYKKYEPNRVLSRFVHHMAKL